MDKNERLVYFHGGDIVKLKREIINSPKEMVVLRVVKQTMDDNKKFLVGVKVMWFDAFGSPHKEIFNTKDLEKVGRTDD